MNRKEERSFSRASSAEYGKHIFTTRKIHLCDSWGKRWPHSALIVLEGTQENARLKKETFCGLKLFKEFLQSKPVERYSRYSSHRAPVHIQLLLSIRLNLQLQIFSRAYWLILIVNKRKETWIYKWCYASTSEQFDNLSSKTETNWRQFCMHMSCYWQLISSHFNLVMTKFRINNRTDARIPDFRVQFVTCSVCLCNKNTPRYMAQRNPHFVSIFIGTFHFFFYWQMRNVIFVHLTHLFSLICFQISGSGLARWK